MVAVACLLLALSSGATALTVGHLRPTWWSCRTALVCREADATLLDPANGKTLKCLIAGTVVVEVPGAEDEVYGALYPADTPITLAQMEDDALVPLMEAEERALFSMAQRACKDMDIELLDTEVGSTSAGKQLSLKRVSSRENEFGAPQYLLSDLMDLVRRPKGYHYYCRLGITLEDIYPGEDWNYVFGQADVMERVGVFSFARHSPLFYDGVHATEALDPETRLLSDARQAKWLRNCLHTMTHEIGHMFGIRHCIYYHCLLNGSNGPHDSAGSTFMCPVDLRKLLHALSTVPRNKGEHPCALERYRAMLQVWQIGRASCRERV